MKISEKRKYDRVAITLSRDVKITELSSGRKMKGRMTSVSTGGIGITTEVYLPLGMKTAVSFNIREGSNFNGLIAKVIAVKNFPEGFAAGLEFIDLAPDDSKRLKTVVDDVSVMRGLKHFEFLTHEEAIVLRGICKEMNFKRHEIIYAEGRENNYFYAVAKGKVSITKKSNIDTKKEEVLELIRERELFGEMALFKGKSEATARAYTDCVLFQLSLADFNNLYKTNYDFATKLLIELIRSLSRRIKRMDQEIVDTLYPGSVKELVLKTAKT